MRCKKKCKKTIHPGKKLRSSDENIPSTSSHVETRIAMAGEIDEQEFEHFEMERIHGRRPLRTPIRGVFPRSAFTAPTGPPTMIAPRFKDAPKRSKKRAHSEPPTFGGFGSSCFRRRSLDQTDVATLVVDESDEDELVFSNIRLATAEERGLGYQKKYIATGKDAKDWLARSQESERQHQA
jgi:hypothetical protein